MTDERTMSGHPDTLTLSAFAGYLGVAKSYVTKLKHADRLVLTDDDRVQVAASLARIRDTADPARARDIADPASAPAPPTDPDTADHDRTSSSYPAARAVKERYLALGAKRDYELSCGKLLDVGATEAYLADAVVTLRTRLEALAPMLGPQMAAEANEARCVALLAEAVERCLEDLAQAFRRQAAA